VAEMVAVKTEPTMPPLPALSLMQRETTMYCGSAPLNRDQSPTPSTTNSHPLLQSTIRALPSRAELEFPQNHISNFRKIAFLEFPEEISMLVLKEKTEKMRDEREKTENTRGKKKKIINKSRKVEREIIIIKKKYLINIRKIKGIYYRVFFIGK
jgi:hypothetical protein